MSTSEKVKSWLPKKKEEPKEEIETIEKVSVDDFKEEKKEKKEKMAPEVKAEVREEDIVKRDGDGNRVPSYL